MVLFLAFLFGTLMLALLFREIWNAALSIATETVSPIVPCRRRRLTWCGLATLVLLISVLLVYVLFPGPTLLFGPRDGLSGTLISLVVRIAVVCLTPPLVFLLVALLFHHYLPRHVRERESLVSPVGRRLKRGAH